MGNGTGRVLEWGKPPQVQTPQEWASYQADSAPPGTWQPNMDEQWKLRWKAKLLGQKSGKLRVEIRKSTDVSHAGSVQVVMIVFEDGSVVMSMNGRAGFDREGFWALTAAVSEATSAMQLYRASQRGEPLSGKYQDLVDEAAGSGE